MLIGQLRKILLRLLPDWTERKIRAVRKYGKTLYKLYKQNSTPYYIRTNHPILTISSDDWGSIFLRTQNDGDTEEEINKLANLLEDTKDVFGNSAKLNAYITTSIPNFKAIRNSQFNRYYCDPTYKSRNSVIEAWEKGVGSGVFSLELHGRDHFNTEAWLDYLRSGSEYFLPAFFDNRVAYREVWTEASQKFSEIRYFSREYVDGMKWPSLPIPVDKQYQLLSEGIKTFVDMFGFRPQVFLAPGCAFDENTEIAVSQNGIKYLETYSNHIIAVDKHGTPIYRRIRWGEKLAGGVIALIRDAHYEPSWQKGWGRSTKKTINNETNKALISIKRAFRRNEPAILVTHAQNYIGNSNDVDMVLEGLENILKRVIENWQNVHFISAKELGKLISNSQKEDENKIVTALYNNPIRPNIFISLFWTIYDFFSLLYHNG